METKYRIVKNGLGEYHAECSYGGCSYGGPAGRWYPVSDLLKQKSITAIQETLADYVKAKTWTPVELDVFGNELPHSLDTPATHPVYSSRDAPS